jgi:tRNA(Ile)-lysidine synthase
LVSLQKKNEIVLEIEAFLGYFYVIQKYVLMHVCREFDIDCTGVDYNRLNSAIEIIKQKRIGSRLLLSSEVELMVDHDGIVVSRPQHSEHSRIKVSCNADGETAFAGFKLSWWRIDKERVDYSLGENVAFLDFNKTGDTLFVRTINPGDRFYPLNFKGSKKVSDYLSDRKIPLRFREKIPIIETTDAIVWIGGYRIDDRYKVEKITQNVLKFEINEISNVV